MKREINSLEDCRTAEDLQYMYERTGNIVYLFTSEATLLIFNESDNQEDNTKVEK